MNDHPAQHADLGLRERKKLRTRAAITDAALELFLQHGFEAVTTAQIAEAAEVSEATLFNYFRVKEDLVYERLDGFWTSLLDAVEQRRSGQGIVDAVEGFVLARMVGELKAEELERLVATSRMIAHSPTLLARERASYDDAAAGLAAIVRATTAFKDDALAIAYMVLGVHKSLVLYWRAQLLAGTQLRVINERIAERTRAGYTILRRAVDDQPV